MDDEDIVLAALKNTGEALEFASERLKNNRAIVYQATYQYKESLKFASEEVQKEIGKQDPILYLKSYLLHSELQKNILEKDILSSKQKMKI